MPLDILVDVSMALAILEEVLIPLDLPMEVSMPLALVGEIFMPLVPEMD